MDWGGGAPERGGCVGIGWKVGFFLGGEQVEGFAGVVVEPVVGQAAGEVVADGRGDGDVGVVGAAEWFEPHVLELGDEGFQRDAVLEAEGNGDGEHVHQARGGGTFLAELGEDLAQGAVGRGVGSGEELGVADLERGGDAVPFAGHAFAGRGGMGAGGCGLGRGQRRISPRHYY
jgi:hypothetical protein